MKKIPTVFKRIFEDHKPKAVLNEFTNDDCREAFLNGIATVKWDGACCCLMNGELYKRYDAKRGKTPPEGAIPCSDPDPVTGHWPHWVKADRDNPADKWFWDAYDTADMFNAMYGNEHLNDGTYEAIGPAFQNNPYGLDVNVLQPHGYNLVEVGRTYEDVKAYLAAEPIEGIVFWLDGAPVCKIKRTDFGFKWPVRED